MQDQEDKQEQQDQESEQGWQDQPDSKDQDSFDNRDESVDTREGLDTSEVEMQVDDPAEDSNEWSVQEHQEDQEMSDGPEDNLDSELPVDSNSQQDNQDVQPDTQMAQEYSETHEENFQQPNETEALSENSDNDQPSETDAPSENSDGNNDRPADEQLADNTAGKKILLVEDDEALAAVYRSRLELEGFEIHEVHNGEEALQAAKDVHPDLILLDAMMPKISGFDVLDILRQTPETANVRVIMLTALSQPKDKEKAESLGVDDYLVKSQVVIGDVVERVKHHLNMA